MAAHQQGGDQCRMCATDSPGASRDDPDRNPCRHERDERRGERMSWFQETRDKSVEPRSQRGLVQQRFPRFVQAGLPHGLECRRICESEAPQSPQRGLFIEAVVSQHKHCRNHAADQNQRGKCGRSIEAGEQSLSRAGDHAQQFSVIQRGGDRDKWSHRRITDFHVTGVVLFSIE